MTSRLTLPGYTSEELASVSNTVPSRSLDDFWKEACEGVFHREVTKIQMRYVTLAKYVLSCRDAVRAGLQREWPGIKEENLTECTEAILEHRIVKLRKDATERVARLRETMERQIELISSPSANDR